MESIFSTEIRAYTIVRIYDERTFLEPIAHLFLLGGTTFLLFSAEMDVLFQYVRLVRDGVLVLEHADERTFLEPIAHLFLLGGTTFLLFSAEMDVLFQYVRLVRDGVLVLEHAADV